MRGKSCRLRISRRMKSCFINDVIGNTSSPTRLEGAGLPSLAAQGGGGFGAPGGALGKLHPDRGRLCPPEAMMGMKKGGFRE
jgi:hypothetical protein